MNLGKSARRIKETPTNKPELLEVWRNMYNENIVIDSKWRVLKNIGENYGVSSTTVYYHLFPEYNKKQKKYPSKRWSYERTVPELRKKIIIYKRKYIAARRHIDDHIRKAFQKLDPEEGMTLERLSYDVNDEVGIFFHPNTISGLVARLEAINGYKLLVEIHGHDVPHYTLSKKAQR